MNRLFYFLGFVLLSIASNGLLGQDKPNILLIISDDLGIDATNGYHNSTLLPTTPHLDSLMANGLVFDNVWAAPKCTPTRAAIMSGKYGIKTGVLGTPGNLATSHTSLIRELSSTTNGTYANALIGKWHLSQGGGLDVPMEHGIDFYSGSYGASVNAYDNWVQTEEGINSTETDYVTSVFTDKSIDWVNEQNSPWLLWLAHVAPHSPIHLPPDSLYTLSSTGSNFRKYIAMIEAMDHEIGRLLGGIPAQELDNTLIIYIGDNGTPNIFLQNYPSGHGKSSIYEGGIRVPMIVSGVGVKRTGEREAALIHAADIYATIIEITGTELPGGMYNSLSFDHLLNGTDGNTRDYNYSELEDGANSGWTIRNQQYKLLEFDSGEREFYDLSLDSLEFNNLMDGTLSSEQLAIIDDLDIEASVIRAGWSCRDHIQNGDEEGVDCGSSVCNPCELTTAATDIFLEATCIEIVPNPTDSVFEIRGLLGDYIIRILDINGTTYQTLNTTTSDIEIDITDLPIGLYFISIVNSTNGSLSMETIIKTN
jgi:arylsulfatase B